jgi:DNA-binding response OmpR family regulator
MPNLKSILLIEDDPNDVELIMTGLAEHNPATEVVAVNDGNEALDYLNYRGKFEGRAVRNPSVVLLDLKLPKLNGLEVLRQIRNDEKLKLMPVVILTSSQEERDVMEGYRLGTNGYVVKPVDFHEFVEAVKQTKAFWAFVNETPPFGMC